MREPRQLLPMAQSVTPLHIRSILVSNGEINYMKILRSVTLSASCQPMSSCATDCFFLVQCYSEKQVGKHLCNIIFILANTLCQYPMLYLGWQRSAEDYIKIQISPSKCLVDTFRIGKQLTINPHPKNNIQIF